MKNFDLFAGWLFWIVAVFFLLIGIFKGTSTHATANIILMLVMEMYRRVVLKQ